ncbi:MAG: hypothetical protein JWN44_7187 [Myxococcales bacterium]|nr:hypothetical protein [Myxococcales bacterium]
MSRSTALAVSFALLAAPAAAHADWSGCYLGPTSTQSCSVGGTPAAILAAIAAPILVAGAASTVAGELQKRHVELPAGDDDPGTTTRPRQPSLSLVPSTPDPYREAAGTKLAGPRERHRKPDPAFELNERATNIALVATGAMVAGAVIANIVKAAK